MRAGSFKATPALRLERLRLGLTQAQFAGRAGIDRGHLSYIERGVRSVRPATARALAKVLRLSLSQALDQGFLELDMDAITNGEAR